MISAFPAYYLSRKWVWGKSGKSHFKKEVLPFWIFVFIGLVFSTAMVALGAHVTDTAGGNSVALWEKLLPNVLNAAVVLHPLDHPLLPDGEAVRAAPRAGRGARRRGLHHRRRGRGEAGRGRSGGGRAGEPAGRPTRRPRADPPPPWTPISSPAPRRPAASCPPTRATRSTRRPWPCPTAARRCSRSAATAASRRSTSAPAPESATPCSSPSTTIGAARRTSPGWEWHEPDLVDPEVGRIDTLPRFRRTIHDADLESSVVALVGDSPTVGRHWAIPLSLLFIDGGHGSEPAHRDFELWTPHVEPGRAAVHPRRVPRPGRRRSPAVRDLPAGPRVGPLRRGAGRRLPPGAAPLPPDLGLVRRTSAGELPQDPCLSGVRAGRWC